MDDPTDSGTGQEPLQCAECRTWLSAGQEGVETDNGTFCRGCYDRLTAQLEQVLGEQGQDVNYSMALMGALLGATAGVLLWWGFTVVTNIAFGLVAVAIGFAVGKGTAFFAGNKRSQGLQILSVAVATPAFFYATYLVNRSFIINHYAELQQEIVLPLLPDPALFVQVVKAGFGLMDFVFLAFVVWEAWKIPGPIKLGK